MLIKDLIQLHQSHGLLFFQTTTDLAVENSSSHPGAPDLSASIPTQIEISAPGDFSSKDTLLTRFSAVCHSGRAPLETATDAAESNLGVTTEQMSLAEIAKCVPSAASPGCWLKKSGLS